MTACAESAGTIAAFYLDMPANDGPTGRFCLYHPVPPGRDLAGLVLHVHAFAEEMNKSRRMAAIQSRALAAAGWATLQIDLLGCGDSEGDFGDATWSQWVGDVVAAARWLRARHAHGRQMPFWLWGHRAGALIAVEAAARLGEDANFLLWQPALSGRALLQQFLRLKTMADFESGPRPGGQQALKQQLAAGQHVDVAGYALSAPLARGLERAQLTPPGGGRHVIWLEMSQRPEPTLSPASLSVIETWRSAGHDVHARSIQGPAFWQTAEIEDAPALVATSLAALESMRNSNASAVRTSAEGAR